LECTPSLQADASGVTKVKIKVHNKHTSEDVYMDPSRFKNAVGKMREEGAKLKSAVKGGREFEVSVDPTDLLFDFTFQCGSAYVFCEYMVYNFPTDEADETLPIRNLVSPYNEIGTVNIKWTPCDENGNTDEDNLLMVNDPSEFLGKTWRYKVEIQGVQNLPLVTDEAYCQYEFNGEVFTTETVEQDTNSPTFAYEAIHTVEIVDQDFLDWLTDPTKNTIRVDVFINPYITHPKQTAINTYNARVQEVWGGGAKDPKFQISELLQENAQLKKYIAELESQVGEEKVSGIKAKLEAAKQQDRDINEKQ
jgi:hypothetical protein